MTMVVRGGAGDAVAVRGSAVALRGGAGDAVAVLAMR